jgi:hypothetical protein
MLFSKEITPEEYRESKAEFELEITRIEARLSTIPQQQKPIDIEQALENAFNLADRYAQEPAEQKEKSSVQCFRKTSFSMENNIEPQK